MKYLYSYIINICDYFCYNKNDNDLNEKLLNKEFIEEKSAIYYNKLLDSDYDKCINNKNTRTIQEYIDDKKNEDYFNMNKYIKNIREEHV